MELQQTVLYNTEETEEKCGGGCGFLVEAN